MNQLLSHQYLEQGNSAKGVKVKRKSFQTISPTSEIIEEISKGRIVVLLNSEKNESDGAFVMAAQFVTAEAINFISKHARGLLCLTLSEQCGKQLNLSPMVVCNDAKVSTNYTVSINAAEGITAGITAVDRARTIQAAVHVNARPQDIVSPGHVFPLIAQNGGVLVRAGHTEAACDLAKLANLDASAVFCKILKDNGEMAELPELLAIASDSGLKVGTIDDLLSYRSQNECLVKRVADRAIETSMGVFRLVAYQESLTNELHLALVKGNIVKDRSIHVRIHEPLSVLDLLDVADTKSHWTLPKAMQMISQVGRGIIVMLRREEKSEDIINAINSTSCSSKNRYSLKDYGVSAQILRDLGVLNMRLMGDSENMPNMSDFGLNLTDLVTVSD